MTIIQARVMQSEVEALGGVYDVNSVSGGSFASESASVPLSFSPRLISRLPQHNVPSAAILRGLRAAFWGCAGFAFAGSPLLSPRSCRRALIDSPPTALLVSITCLYGIGKVGHRIKKPVKVAAIEEGEGEKMKA